MAKKEWIRVDIVCGSDLAEELSAELAEAFGVGVETGEASVRFYLEGDRLNAERESRLKEVLEDLQQWNRTREPLSYTIERIEEEDWADRWKVHFKPLRIGRRWLICPTWEAVSPGGQDLLIRMDPGRAFGTGHHESTRLCLEWLEDWGGGERDLHARSLLDLGTGSGILAIGGALLGFGRVTGIDNAPEALEVARENVALNRVEETVALIVGSADAVSARFDVVLANIQAFPLMDMAPSLARKVNRPGRLVLSGILVEQQEMVQTAYEAQGLRLLEVRTAGEWCLLAFE